MMPDSSLQAEHHKRRAQHGAGNLVEFKTIHMRDPNPLKPLIGRGN